MSTPDAPLPDLSATTPGRTELVAAAHTLARHGLVNAFGHVSVREGHMVVITPPIALSEVGSDDLLAVPVDADTLPPGTPPEAWAHLAVYRARPDVGAVVRAMPPSAFAVSAVTARLPVLHGQSSWLGSEVPIHPGSVLLRTDDLARAMAATLGSQHAVVLRGNGAVTTAASPGLAMARMFLLEAACRVWLDAASVAVPQPLPSETITAWQATTAQLLPRLWDQLREHPRPD